MDKKIFNHFLQYSQFTYPGLYENYLQSLPNNVREFGPLVRNQIIHRTSLSDENTVKDPDLIYVDMKNIPWWRQAEDDNFNTAVAIIAELFRRDPNGFTLERKGKDKLVLTCRHTTLLVASIFKAKGIPCRIRSGYAPYFPFEKGISSDHWINEYWNKKENRWIIIDIDGSEHDTGLDMLDLPKDAFDYPAKAWLDVRAGKVDGDHFWNAKPATGLKVVGWALFYDLHCLMNNEIPYIHNPAYFYFKWDNLTEDDRKKLDDLAKLLLDPEKNFDDLINIWNTEKKFRILKGGLL